MLKEEFHYYVDHQDEMVKQYDGKYIVLKNKKVIGVYDNAVDAYMLTAKEHELGTFLVQKVSPGEDDYTFTYIGNRVKF